MAVRLRVSLIASTSAFCRHHQRRQQQQQQQQQQSLVTTVMKTTRLLAASPTRDDHTSRKTSGVVILRGFLVPAFDFSGIVNKWRLRADVS